MVHRGRVRIAKNELRPGLRFEFRSGLQCIGVGVRVRVRIGFVATVMARWGIVSITLRVNSSISLTCNYERWEPRVGYRVACAVRLSCKLIMLALGLASNLTLTDLERPSVQVLPNLANPHVPLTWQILTVPLTLTLTLTSPHIGLISKSLISA